MLTNKKIWEDKWYCNLSKILNIGYCLKKMGKIGMRTHKEDQTCEVIEDKIFCMHRCSNLQMLCIWFLPVFVYLKLQVFILIWPNCYDCGMFSMLLHAFTCTCIPCFMDVIRSAKSVCKAKIHTTKYAAVWVQVYWPMCSPDTLSRLFVKAEK
jgi:hypothetical protein